jgi:alcohol dehydrogenase
MKAAVYNTFNGAIHIKQVDDPVLAETEAIIEVQASGICRSDWHGWKGHDPDIQLPHVPGHEFSGIVKEVGSKVSLFQAGDRVTAPFCCGCSTCSQCITGNQHICDNHFQPGFTDWGSFAQYVKIKNADFNLVRLPSTIDFISAAGLGCRFITAFHGIVNQGKVDDSMFVAIHGCGGVGLSAVMIAAVYGAKVVAVDITEESLQKAKSVGAAYTINATKENVVGKVLEITGNGANLSMDALGSHETSRNSINCLAKKGKHIQAGILGSANDITVSTADLIAKETEIIGSHGMPLADYDIIFDLISSKKVDLSLLIDRTVKLEDVHQELLNMDTYANSGMVIIDQF